MSTVDFVIGCLCGAVIICMFVWIAFALRIAFTQMDLMLGFLRNCSFIDSLAKFKQGGLWVSCYWLVVFQGLLLFPVYILGSELLMLKILDGFQFSSSVG